MGNGIVSSVFDNQQEAEVAVSKLRAAGVDDSAISIIAQDEGKHSVTDGAGEGVSSEFVGKVAAGAGIGTLLGIAALAIPGVGPLVAAGAIASAAIPGAAVTGALVGAAAGGLAKVLTDHGVSDDDAVYYEDRVNNGGVFVSVKLDDAAIDPTMAEDILYDAGGHSASRTKALKPMATQY